MGHLIEEYEKNLGVQRLKPVVNKHFFPIGDSRYILIHAPQNMQVKKYKHYPMVVDLLRTFCQEHGIKIYQIDDRQDLIMGIDKLFCGLSFRQKAYLISKADVFISVDNVYSQYASSQGVPTVNLFSNVFANTTKGAWGNKQVNLEASWDGKPSFQVADPREPINTIMPENVVSGVLNLLNSKAKINFETVHIGPRFYVNAIEVVPTEYKNLELFKDKEITVRADYACNEEALINYCFNHKCSLVLKNTVIQPAKIQNFAKNISKISFIFDSLEQGIPEKYFDILNNMGVQTEIIITNESILSDTKMLFFDQQVVLYKPKTERPENISPDSCFFSFKKVIEGDKIYPSKAHWKKNEIPLDNPHKIIDTPAYWEELDYYYIYEQKIKQSQNGRPIPSN